MIAVNLVKTLDPFIEGELEDFDKTQIENCEELSGNPMGKMMLGIISYIYMEQAQQYLGGLDGAQAHMK